MRGGLPASPAKGSTGVIICQYYIFILLCMNHSNRRHESFRMTAIQKKNRSEGRPLGRRDDRDGRRRKAATTQMQKEWWRVRERRIRRKRETIGRREWRSQGRSEIRARG